MASTISGNDNFDSGSPSITLLGTLSSPSGSSVTLSSVDLSGYKQLHIHCTNIQLNSTQWYGLNGSGEANAVCKFGTGAGVPGYGASAFCIVNLDTGWGFSSGSGNTVNNGTGWSANYDSYGGGKYYGVTTSTTSLTMYARSGYTFSSQGDFKFYGIR